MSKSSGNGIDPLDMIDKFGTDAVRLRPGDRHCPGHGLPPLRGENRGIPQLVNKIWNGCRFALMNIPESEYHKKFDPAQIKTQADKWIVSGSKSDHRSRFRHGEFPFFRSRPKIYDFTLSLYCGWSLKCPKATHGKSADSHAKDAAGRQAHPQYARNNPQTNT